MTANMPCKNVTRSLPDFHTHVSWAMEGPQSLEDFCVLFRKQDDSVMDLHGACGNSPSRREYW